MTAPQYRQSGILGHHDGYAAPRHFVDNWKMRAPFDVQVGWRTAWDLGCPVGCDSISGTIRLYSPGEMLLVVRNGAFKTAFDTTNRELNTDHRKTWEDCGNLWHPMGYDECQYCEFLD